MMDTPLRPTQCSVPFLSEILSTLDSFSVFTKKRTERNGVALSGGRWYNELDLKGTLINMAGLTGKQEHFARLVAAGASASAAYREAYDTSGYGSAVAAGVDAARMASKPAVRLRINELKAEIEELELWSRVDSLTAMMQIVRDKKARNADKVAATKVINSMHGWERKTVNFNDSGKEAPRTFSEMYGALESSGEAESGEPTE